MVGERELEESDFLKDPQWRTGRRTNYSKHMPKDPNICQYKIIDFAGVGVKSMGEQFLPTV